LPNLVVPKDNYEIGKFGLMRKQYLKNHRRILFVNLLTSGKLNEHPYEIDQVTNERMGFLTKQMAKSEGVTEQLRAKNQLLWVQKMNSIRNRVGKIIREELIYN